MQHYRSIWNIQGNAFSFVPSGAPIILTHMEITALECDPSTECDRKDKQEAPSIVRVLKLQQNGCLIGWMHMDIKYRGLRVIMVRI